MNHYLISFKEFKVTFKVIFRMSYKLEEISPNMVHEFLLKYYRNYVKSERMQYLILYTHEYIISKL